MSIHEHHKAVVLRYINEVWNGNQPELLDEILDPAFYDYSYEPRNRTGLEQTLELAHSAFPGHQVIIEEIAVDGDTVGVCETFKGVQSGPFRGQPGSGKAFEVGRYEFFKFKDGKIVSHRGLLDLPALLRQLGIE